MRISDIGGMTCSVARTLAVIGDAWTLLILRELFLGQRRFEEFQAQTGMAPYLLSRRLAKLVGEGILERAAYRERPARYEYRLTEKGRDLHAVILSMARWGDRWTAGEAGPPARLIHKGCGQAMEPRLVCSACGEPIGPQDVRLRIGPAMAAERTQARARLKARLRAPERRAAGTRAQTP